MTSSRKGHRKQTERRLDVIKVQIEDVNLDTIPPIAQGRDRHQWGLLDIDLSHGIGGKFPTPQVGETWWIKRTTGRAWILDHKVDVNRIESVKTVTGGGAGDTPETVFLGFNLRERKTHDEWEAYVTFDPGDITVEGDTADRYVVSWVPCNQRGTILQGKRPRQYTWHPPDLSIDDENDPGNEYYVILPGNIANPKTWWYKARVRGISASGARGRWSEWTQAKLTRPLPDPDIPIPDNVTLDFRIHERKTHLEFRGIVEFDGVGYWTIAGGDFEDDVSRYAVQLQPLMVDDGAVPADVIVEASVVYPWDSTDPPSMHKFVRADPNGDGKPLWAQRATVEDKDDEDDSFFDHLGTVGEDYDFESTFILVREDITVPATPFEIMVGAEKMIVIDRIHYQSLDPCEEIDPTLYQYEVIREFSGTEAEEHVENDEVLYLTNSQRYKAVFPKIGRPKTIFQRARVRAIDRYNRRGFPSAWTDPTLPWTETDDQPPYPTGLTLDFDKQEKTRHSHWRAIARWDESDYDVPGGDKEVDVDRYAVQLEANDQSTLASGCDDSQGTISVNEVVRPSGADTLPFNIEIDNEAMTVTARPSDTPNNWSAGSHTYTVTRGYHDTTPAAHSGGARVWKRPPRHKVVSAKYDDDKNTWAHANFRPVWRKWYYRVRVRAHDRFNRRSPWSPWTSAGTPSDTTPPPLPTSVAVEVNQHTVHVTWDAPEDSLDTDPTLKTIHEDIEFFQVQLSDASNFSSILRSDRYTKHLQKTWKIQKPASRTFYARVRSVDASGNRSNWVSNNSTNSGPPTPTITSFDFDTQGTRNARLRNVITISTVSFADDEIGSYIVQQVKKPNNVTPTAGDRRNVHRIEGDATSDELHTVFHDIPKRHWCFARVRAIDKQGRKSSWSGWSSAQAIAGPPLDVTNVQIRKEKKRVQIDWDPPVDAYGDPDQSVSHYQVQIARNSGYSDLVVNSKHIVNTHYRYAVPDADVGTPHHLRVRTVDSNGEVGNWNGGSHTADPDVTANAEPGTIRRFARGSIPNVNVDWLRCHGASFSVAAYFPLWSVIGYTYGNGDNYPNTFQVPDIKNRKVINDGNLYNLGDTEGQPVEGSRYSTHGHSNHGHLHGHSAGGHAHGHGHPGHKHKHGHLTEDQHTHGGVTGGGLVANPTTTGGYNKTSGGTGENVTGVGHSHDVTGSTGGGITHQHGDKDTDETTSNDNSNGPDSFYSDNSGESNNDPKNSPYVVMIACIKT